MTMPGFMIDGVGSQAPGRPDAYYTYTWEIPWIYNRSGLSGPLIYLKDSTLPTVSFDKELVQGASLNYKFANGVTWEDVRVSWYDTKGLLAIIQQWRQQVWTEKEGLAPADAYKEQTILESQLPDGSAENQWQLMNSWPSTIKYGELTYTSADLKIVEVIITYDWAVETPA